MNIKGGSDLEGIKCIFFDIGYTLINEDEVWKQRCIEQSKTEEAKAYNLTPEQIYDEIVQSSLSYMPQYRAVIDKFGFKHPAPYRHQFEKLYDCADTVLHTLANKYKLGIIANQSDGIKNRLSEFGILSYFSFIISSWDYKVMKPDSRLFEIALEKSGYNPSETVMIGDRLDNDIFPAKQLGMKTIWIKQGFGGMQSPKTSEYLPDMEISKLADLLDIF